jgi:transcriptional regulator GlxA family with amidase domain
MASVSLKIAGSSPLGADNEMSSRPADAVHPAVKKAREYMEAHFAEKVSVGALAALVSLSPYHFARAFKKETGLPPHACLENIRIRKVLEFLDRGHSLVSAALSAGYVDQSHLTHRFKRLLGITPGQYVMSRRVSFSHDAEVEPCGMTR